MLDMPEHFPIGVDADGKGPMQEHDPQYVRTICWCGTEGCRMYLHELHLDGPLRYPGGKDGMYHVVCSCRKYMSPPGSAPDSAKMWESAMQHRRTKGAPR